MRITRSHPGSAARFPPSRRHRHQIAADPARSRYPVGDGGDGPGQGGAVDHHPGPQAGARDGAARRNAAAAAAGHPGPGRCRRARRRDVRARHSGAERSRDGSGADGRRRAWRALSAGYVLLRLPLEIKDLFREWLEANVPDRAKHVMALVRQMRGGKDYDANWNTRMNGTGPYAEMMARRFHMAVKRLGLNQPAARSPHSSSARCRLEISSRSSELPRISKGLLSSAVDSGRHAPGTDPCP